MGWQSLLNNCEYDESAAREWRAFNVGYGKLVPWAKFENLETLDSLSQNPSGALTFKIGRHQHIKKSSIRTDFFN